MKTKKVLKYVSMIWGIIVTLLFLLVLGSKIISKLSEEGFGYLSIILKDCINWYDNPSGFFFTYLIGYTIIWWKPFWGSIIIIFVSGIYVIIAGFDGPPFLAGPTFLVGLLYFINWIVTRKIKPRPLNT